MSKHTPGPWVVLKQTQTISILSTDRHKRYVAEIDTRMGGIMQEEQNANARLIAAAPEMYEAIKLALGSHAFQDELDQEDFTKLLDSIKNIEGIED